MSLISYTPNWENLAASNQFLFLMPLQGLKSGFGWNQNDLNHDFNVVRKSLFNHSSLSALLWLVITSIHILHNSEIDICFLFSRDTHYSFLKQWFTLKTFEIHFRYFWKWMIVWVFHLPKVIEVDIYEVIEKWASSSSTGQSSLIFGGI